MPKPLTVIKEVVAVSLNLGDVRQQFSSPAQFAGCLTNEVCFCLGCRSPATRIRAP